MERKMHNNLPHSSFPQLFGSEAYRDLHSCQCSGPSPHFHTYLCNVPKKIERCVFIQRKINVMI